MLLKVSVDMWIFGYVDIISYDSLPVIDRLGKEINNEDSVLYWYEVSLVPNIFTA